VGGQHHAPAALPPGKTRYPLYRRLGGPQGRSGCVWKIAPPPGFDHRTVRPVASRYTDRATWPTKQLNSTAENLPPSSVRCRLWSFTSSSATCLHDLVLCTEATLSTSLTFTSLPALTTCTIFTPNEQYEWKKNEKERQNFKKQLCHKYFESHSNSH
jgi:hypothetical protein